MPLFEIFISMFLEEIAVLIRKGIKSDYIAKEDNLRFLKGKLKINEQIKYNYIHKERFFVAYDEYSSDRVENRLIKTTLQYLYKKSKSSRNQQRIREFLFVIDEVKPSKNFKTDFTKVKSNRQMRDYEQVLLWCKTFLLGNSFSPYRGNSVAFALLFDMNKLFESYVYDYLRKDGEYISITAQDRSHYLAWEDGVGKFRLKPDIVIRDDIPVVIDTKWKLLSEEKSNQGITQADMYQLYAYGKKYGAKKLYLIYPKDDDVNESLFDYYKDNSAKSLKLEIRFFDVLNQEKKHFDLERKCE
jgi:5-methylcytosine-specific restriction enzyme subunit McrC